MKTLVKSIPMTCVGEIPMEILMEIGPSNNVPGGADWRHPSPTRAESLRQVRPRTGDLKMDEFTSQTGPGVACSVDDF